MVLGMGSDNNFLTNDIQKSFMVGFNSDLPTFFVGSSTGDGTTGRIGIGNITAPTAKLHIKADINEDAAIMLQPTGSATTARIFFGDNNHSISAKTGENLVFKTGSGNHFVFTNGRVGIGTNAPTQTLDVQGTLRVSSLSSSTTKMIVTTSTGTLSTMNIPVGDNLGNHIATQNINMNGKYLSGDGTNKGVFVNTVGNVGIGTNTPSEKLEVAGTIKATTFSGDGSQLTNLTGDNLGNHTATQNINLNGQYLSGNGADNGIFVNVLGNVGIGTNDAQATLHVNGDVKLLAGNVTNQLQILSGEAIPQRRGISLPVDPNGAFNFYIHAYQTDAAFNFKESNANVSLLTIKKDGTVGIGTSQTNGNKLAVAGNISAQTINVTGLKLIDNNQGAGKLLQSDASGNAAWVNPPPTDDGDWIMDGDNIYRNIGKVGIGTSNVSNSALLTVDGKVLIGSSDLNLPAAYKLFVQDGILTERLSVKTVTNWADEVFNVDYNLLSIEEVAGFIKAHNHLPDIPSEHEIKTNGYDVAEMDALLLKKIEELTLYIIELKKENFILRESISKIQFNN
jgi:hypothetical protein